MYTIWWNCPSPEVDTSGAIRAKELLATLRYRYIFLLSWYPIEKKTNKKTGEKKMGMGKMLSSSSLMISTYLLVLTLLYPAGCSAAKSSSSRRGEGGGDWG
ncbi:hypothetical protein OUZ56_019891 [Daphnia magna]|uniref:Uncharacterized protein n=1 Tax=Daphnia magna TaxID=35525 RepID=A0ABQ9ZCZ2_9CRUS|nr:hypothetical protein OUZ56_019891 [Daphnia magna]